MLQRFSVSTFVCGIFLSAAVAAFAAAADPAPAGGAKPGDRIGPPPVEASAGQPAAPAATAPPAKLEATPGQPAAAAAAAGQSAANGTPRKANFVPILPTKDYTPPSIFIEQPNFDFGDVIKGEVITHRFQVENRGGSALMIQKVRPSCGCTLVDESQMDKVIAPGAKGSFELKIETSRLTVGKQQKYADVSSNDPKQAQTRVFLQGKIDALLKADPEQPRIQTVRGKGQGTTEITLTKNLPGDLKILGARSQSGRLLVDLKETQPGSAYKLAVTTNYGPKETQSYFSEQLQIEVQMGERKLSQDLYVTVQVKDRIEITPRSLYWKRTDFQALRDQKTPVVKTVDIKAAVEDPYKFKITGSKVDDPFFKIAVEPIKDGREYRLTVTIDQLPGDLPDKKNPNMKGNITITTDDPMMPEISVRCIAFF